MVGNKAFIGHIIKQARKELRSYDIKRPKRVRLLSTPSQAFIVAQHLLPDLFPRTIIEVVNAAAVQSEAPLKEQESALRGVAPFGDAAPTNREARAEQDSGSIHTLIPISRDELTARFMTLFLEDRDDTELFTNQFFLFSMAHVELQRYADMHGLKKIDPILNEKEQEAAALIERIQKEQSQTESSILQSYLHLRKEIGAQKEAHKKEKK